MTWLTQADSAASAGERLAKLWERPGIVTIPGAHNGLAAMLARRAGFEALYLSGAALSASMGLADLGIMTVEELTLFARMVCRAAGLPLIVDADTGYGGILNVMRVVRELEDAGAAAIQIEDQLLPKKCGHLNDKLLAAPEEMAARIAAALRARRSTRASSHAPTRRRQKESTPRSSARGLPRGRRRCDFSRGADRRRDVPAVRPEFEAPLLANMTEFGRTPYFTARRVRGIWLQDGYLAGLLAAGRGEIDRRTLPEVTREGQRRGDAQSDADAGGVV